MMTILAALDGKQIHDGNRDDWLAARRFAIGASEAAAVLGVSQFEAPIDIWQRKCGIVGDREDTEAMRFGRLLEPILAAEYQERTGHTFTGTQLFFTHPEKPYVVATLDGLRDDGRIVELKTASAWAREWGDEDTDQVPEPYLVQVHHQMAVTGAGLADLAVLIGGQRFRIYTVPRNDDLINLLLETHERFWKCVERRTPPDWGRFDARALAVINPECQGSVDLDDPETLAAIERYEALGGIIKEYEAEREECKTRVLAAMKSRQFGNLPDGRIVKRFLEQVAEKQVSYTSKAHIRHYLKILKGTPQ